MSSRPVLVCPHLSVLPLLQVLSSITWSSAERKNETLSTCGRLWVSTNGGASFAPTSHHSYKVTALECTASAWQPF